MSLETDALLPMAMLSSPVLMMQSVISALVSARSTPSVLCEGFTGAAESGRVNLDALERDIAGGAFDDKDLTGRVGAGDILDEHPRACPEVDHERADCRRIGFAIFPPRQALAIYRRRSR